MRWANARMPIPMKKAVVTVGIRGRVFFTRRIGLGCRKTLIGSTASNANIMLVMVMDAAIESTAP